MYIDMDTIKNFLFTIVIGLGLVAAGYRLATLKQVKIRQLMISNMVHELLMKGIIDQTKFEKYLADNAKPKNTNLPSK